MKRSVDSLGNNLDDPPTKRGGGEERDRQEANEENQDVSNYVLVNKCRALALELMSSKRSLGEARKELDLMRKQTNEMESLVSLVQRSWSKIDIDTSLLLDSIGDNEAKENPQYSSAALQMLLDVRNRWIFLDPTNVSHLPKLQIDQWSSAADIKTAETSAKAKEEEFQEEFKQNEQDSSSSAETVAQLIPQQVESHLQRHVAFTMSLLERLCYAINELSDREEDVLLRPLTVAQEQHGAIAALSDANLKLRYELITMQSQVQLAENERIKVEKKLDKSLFTIKAMEEQGHHRHNNVTSTNHTSSSSAAAEAINGQNQDEHTTVSKQQQQQQEQYEQELQQQVATLERQLNESETAKAKAEMMMTERMAKPFSQTEQQVSDMRRTLEELKHQFKQRLAEYIKQVEELMKEKHHLQSTLLIVEKAAMEQVKAVTNATQQEIQRINNENQSMQQKVVEMQALHTISVQMNSQCQELIAIEEIRTRKINQLERNIENLTTEKEQLQRHLDQSRARERELETAIALTAAGVSPTGTVTVESKPGDSHGNGEPLPTNVQALQTILLARQKRYQDIDKELADSKSNVNDLILELETISGEETRSREQNERLLKQLSESQALQRDALEENLRLNEQTAEMKKSVKETESKSELIKTMMIQQDTLLSEARALELTLRSDLSYLKHDRQQQVDRRHSLETKAQDLEHKLQDAESQLQKALKRNQDLQSRCDELTKQCESERKRRFDEVRNVTKRVRLQRESSSSGVAGASSSSSSGGGKLKSTDQDMLDMTLDMLRCSVCHDRFKSVTITRCFHLFCKECIDENLRNRSRKCPACGEKFGQDDVANVYFGN